jgi:hypothetical protein
LRGQAAGLAALPRFLRKRAHRFTSAAAPRLAASLYRDDAHPATENREYTEI